MKKQPKCNICGGAHYKTFCFQAPKKKIAVKKPLKASRKPLKARTSIAPSKPGKPLRRSKIASQSKRERPALISKLDRVYSQYIRRKDAINDMARCVTCGKVAHWRELQNGHFISRRKMPTRWYPMNTHVQCPHCNETLGGNLDKYEKYLIRTYGSTATFHLQQKSQHSGKISNDELRELIKHYQDKLASLL